MSWTRERDLLIAQTMAFVQSVAGKKPTADDRDLWRDPVLRNDVSRDLAIESAPVDAIAEVERPAETVQVDRPSPVRIGDVREEIRGRVAAFRAHQELFHRERDEYCNSVLTKLHASTNYARKALDDQPPKP